MHQGMKDCAVDGMPWYHGFLKLASLPGWKAAIITSVIPPGGTLSSVLRTFGRMSIVFGSLCLACAFRRGKLTENETTRSRSCENHS